LEQEEEDGRRKKKKREKNSQKIYLKNTKKFKKNKIVLKNCPPTPTGVHVSVSQPNLV